jgi:hypothetical protein
MKSNLCPRENTPEYLAYYSDGVEYPGLGKYLAGSLGIRDWLWHGVAAQNFEAVAGPTTIIAEGPPQNDELNRVASAIKQQIGFAQQEANRREFEGKACTGPISTSKLPDWYLNQGQQVNDRRLLIPFKYCEPMTYTATMLPSWLTMTYDNANLIFNGSQAVPSTQTTFKVTVTAKSTSGKTAHVDFTVNVYAAPKATSFGPTYGATFKFIIKATGQVGPSFTLDRSKGGGAALFSGVRTETNFVNITMTAAGVPLVEVDAQGNVVASLVGAPGSVDVVNQAIKRLDDALLKLNLAQIGAVQ